MADLGYSTPVNGKNCVTDYNVVASDVHVRDYWRTLPGDQGANMLLEAVDALDPQADR